MDLTSPGGLNFHAIYGAERRLTEAFGQKS
jgi:hypothetical protein